MIIDIVVFKFIILLFAFYVYPTCLFFLFLCFLYDEFLSFHFISTITLLAIPDFIFLVIASQFTISTLQSLSRVQLFATLWTTA